MNHLQTFASKSSNSLRPFFNIPVPAGPAQPVEQRTEWIDIDEYLRRGSEQIAYIRVYGDSMENVNIYEGDLLVVRRTEGASAGDVVIAEINGEYTVKRLSQHSHGLYLVPANDKYPIRKVTRSDTFSIWAVVTHVIHRF